MEKETMQRGRNIRQQLTSTPGKPMRLRKPLIRNLSSRSSPSYRKWNFYATTRQDQKNRAGQALSSRPISEHIDRRSCTELCWGGPWESKRDHDRHPLWQGCLCCPVLWRIPRYG